MQVSLNGSAVVSPRKTTFLQNSIGERPNPVEATLQFLRNGNQINRLFYAGYTEIRSTTQRNSIAFRKKGKSIRSARMIFFKLNRFRSYRDYAHFCEFHCSLYSPLQRFTLSEILVSFYQSLTENNFVLFSIVLKKSCSLQLY